MWHQILLKIKIAKYLLLKRKEKLIQREMQNALRHPFNFELVATNDCILLTRFAPQELKRLQRCLRSLFLLNDK